MNATKLVVVAAAILVAVALNLGKAGERANQPPAVVGRDTGGPSQADPRAAIFIQRGCSECHGIGALRVKAATDVGPDLTFAYADVVNRYDVSLESFLSNPTGVMRLMLASQLRLTAADRDSILHVLKGVYEEHRAGMDEQIPSFPPTTRRPRARPER
jgi:mono/diheme cytochrome c family protein